MRIVRFANKPRIETDQHDEMRIQELTKREMQDAEGGFPVVYIRLRGRDYPLALNGDRLLK